MPTDTIAKNTLAFVLPLITFCMLVFAQAARAEITASATLSSTTFAAGDHAQLRITVHGTRSAELDIPEIEHVEIHQRGHSSQINMINGSINSSVTINCLVRAYQPGKYTLPPITISTDKTTLTTEPIPFTVTSSTGGAQQSTPTGTAPDPAGTENGELAFIRIEQLKTTSYIGEIVPVTVKAYFRHGIRASLNGAPVLAGDGVVMPQLQEQPAQTRERIGNVAYNVLTWQTTLSSIKEGSHTIHLELEATQLIPQRRTSTSMFGNQSPFDDDFFDSFFGGVREKPLKLVSEEVSLEVLPLPNTGRPATFSGAIGDFSLHTNLEPQQAETGEPLTLQISIRGSGNFDRVDPPHFPANSDWKTYTPSAHFQPQGKHGITGEKLFEQAIVAQSTAVNAVPPLEFSYFDPEEKSYVTVTSTPIPVSISGQPALSAQPEPSASETGSSASSTKIQPSPSALATEPEQMVQLAPLKLQPGAAISRIQPLFKKPLYIMVTAIILAVFFLALLYKSRLINNQESSEEARKRKLRKQLQKKLSEIEIALAENDSAAFLAACRRAVQQHLGTLWQCEPSAITSSNVMKALQNYPELIEIFSIAERSAYSGESLDAPTMENYAIQLKTSLESLI